MLLAAKISLLTRKEFITQVLCTYSTYMYLHTYVGLRRSTTIKVLLQMNFVFVTHHEGLECLGVCLECLEGLECLGGSNRVFPHFNKLFIVLCNPVTRKKVFIFLFGRFSSEISKSSSSYFWKLMFKKNYSKN